MHVELDVLSERYSQKCLQLSHIEQSSKGRETELGHKERELEQLRRENQVYICDRFHFSFSRISPYRLMKIIFDLISSDRFKLMRKITTVIGMLAHNISAHHNLCKQSLQELKTKLAEEISRMRYFITGQRSDMVSLGTTERSASEIEVLLVIRSVVVTKLGPT